MNMLVHAMLSSETTLLLGMLPGIAHLPLRHAQQIDEVEYAALMEYY
jgi:hypothetical protein